MYDILIIGAGPAGLSAALYASRAGKSVLILERMTPGGQLSTIGTIENYPPFSSISGPELAMQFLEAGTKSGAELRYEDAVRLTLGDIKKIETSMGNTYEAHAVILATGAEPRMLGLPGEEALKGRGISYCVTCDGALFRGKAVALAGGSAHAAEEAHFLSQHVEKLYMLCPGAPPKSLVKTANMEVLPYTVPTALIEQNGLLSAITTKARDGEERTLSVRGLFIAMGYTPANRLCTEIPLSPGGYILTHKEMTTEKDGVFAAGDIREKSLRQIVTAASDGATAAVSALRYLKTKEAERK